MLMQIDGTFVFVVISFLVFLFILKTVLFNPITTIIEKREEFYKKNSKIKEKSKEKTKTLIDQKENLLKAAKTEALDILKEAREESAIENSIVLKQTKQEIANSIADNKLELTKQKDIAKSEIKKEVNSIVESIISKVLGESVEVNISDNRINEYLKI